MSYVVLFIHSNDVLFLAIKYAFISFSIRETTGLPRQHLIISKLRTLFHFHKIFNLFQIIEICFYKGFENN